MTSPALRRTPRWDKVARRRLAPPDPDKPVGLMDRIAASAHRLGQRGTPAIGRNEADLAVFVEFETVKRALEMVSHDLARAQADTAVGALVNQTRELAVAVTPKDELFAQPRHGHRPCLDLI